jgi:primosomal protein N''
MIQLYTALIHAQIPELEAKNVLTELENTIHTEVEREFLTMNLTTITPIVREQDGIRNEVRRLNDKIDTVEERLNTKIDAVEERLTAKIDAVEERLTAKIDAVEERLTAKIDVMDAKFEFHDKLLWTIIGLLITLSGFVVTNSIFIYQKLK